MEIRFADCSVRYGDTVALQPLDLTLTERRIGVIGLNGSGKTTFVRAINGLVKPSRGRVTVNGLDTVEDGPAVLSKVGFIFQNPQNQLILPIVADDIALGLKSRGLATSAVAARVEAVLARFDIAHLARRRVHALSGGETQLVAMASVLVTEPDILILDEPTNQLDLKNRKRVIDTLAGLPEAAIVVSHDLSLIESFERVLLFHEGRLIADGAPVDVVRAYEAVALC
ncbi:cobalt ABC transporter ATP-binding protein [Rhizobium sp. Leaf384]|uniref:energy-coupling factor ABC transporter ATP-binding protein n=1 Tax=unclassified Rhizobium TaxID=2613769 RepID=UPI000714118F|nr:MULTISPECIES: ABC transporter ATP-binding protein [unclassified Rhizobium]KQS77370.1 cobalt ABC transporter ATP-binding protein [Rhizobium sp. Leaf383]KQS80722.1 cobalt ABC transporter ATP-binding protein [Rhizobium sp. Leaf384]